MNQKESKFLKSNIFVKNINSNFKTIPFNAVKNTVGDTKYIPSIAREWKNSIYCFNNNNIKNFPIYDIWNNKILMSYFNMYLNYKFINLKKKISRKSKRLSFNKIHISKSEIKHTNNKLVFTIFSYNRERISLLKRIKALKISFFNKIFLIFLNLNIFKKKLNFSAFNKLSYLLNKELNLLRRYKLRLNLNIHKFDSKLLLLNLSNILKKVYKKNIEFNIVNLKSIVYNSDIFTKMLGLRVKNRNSKILKRMYFLLNKAILPQTNIIQERGRVIKSVNFNLPENKYRHKTLNTILNKSNIDELLINLYPSIKFNYNTNFHENENYNEILSTIFNNINYKNLGGIRLEVKGRITKRYRADRAQFSLKWKGGLKNIDSSYKGLSSVNYRGYKSSNTEYSIYTTKRRIGAYAVKGWISGK